MPMNRTTNLQLLKMIFPHDEVSKIDNKIYKRVCLENYFKTRVYYLIFNRSDRGGAEINTLSNKELKEMVKMQKRFKNSYKKIAFKVGNKFYFQSI